MNLTRLVWLSATLLSITACKKPPAAAPKLGWVKVEGMSHECYYPPAWDTLGPGDRKIARADALEEMMTQWTGKRADGVEFDEQMITDVETSLLGQPIMVEEMSGKNTQYCESFMTAGGSTSAWSSWLSGLPAKFNEGQCYNPLVDTYYNYLDLARGWQNKVAVCKGDKVAVKGTEIDYYQYFKGSPWVNAAGDPAKSASGSELPCNIEGCLYGQLIVHFVGESGAVVVKPAGLGVVITAPESGYIEVMINDDDLTDNKYKIESGMEHHTGIEYKPAN